MKTINFNDSKGRTIKVPLDKKDDIIYFLQKGYDYDKSFGAINFNDSKGRTIKVPLDKKDDIIYFLQKGYDFTPTKETPKKERTLVDKLSTLDKSFAQGMRASGDLPANILQGLWETSKMAPNPEMGVTEDDINRAQQSDYNPFDEKNAIGKYGRFSTYAKPLANQMGYSDEELVPDLTDAGSIEKGINTAAEYAGGELLPALITGGSSLGVSGAGKALRNVGKNVGNAAKFGAGSSIYEQGLEEMGFKNPIVADLLTAVKNPLDAARSSAKRLKNPKEKILYPLGNKVFLGKKFNADKAETGKELLGDNNYAANMFTEGLNRPTDYYLRNLGGENYLQKQKNADLELQNIINKIGENIGPNFNDELLQRQIQGLYSSAREGAKNTLTTPRNTREYIQNQKTTTFNPETKAAAESGTMKDAKGLIDELSWYDDDKLVNAGKLINDYQARNQDLAKYFKDGNIASDTDSYYRTVSGSKNAIKKDIEEAGSGLKWLDDLKEGDKRYAKGKTRDNWDKHYHSTIDYSTGDTRLSNLSKKLNDPKQRKKGDSYIDNELDQQKIDKLAELTQFITKNKRVADINPSGTAAANKKWFSTLSALGTLISIPQAIATHSALPLSGLSPFAIKKLGEASGNLMSDPKFLDYAIKVAKSSKNKQAQLSLDAMIQKKTGLTTKQLSTILARDSVNKLTIDKNEESGK